MLAIELKYPTLAIESIERLQEIYLSSQWFCSYCKANGLNIVNAQKLRDLRRKYCTSRVMENFYSLDKSLIHDTGALIYNADETNVCANAKENWLSQMASIPMSQRIN